MPRVLQVRERQAWQMRQSSSLAFSSTRAFALSLLDRRAADGADGETPVEKRLGRGQALGTPNAVWERGEGGSRTVGPSSPPTPRLELR